MPPVSNSTVSEAEGEFPLKDSAALAHQEGERGVADSRKVPPSSGVPPFDELYRDWFHEVCRWCRALGGLNADLEDLSQEVFVVVRRRLPDFDGEHLRAWLYRITQRTVSDYRRRAWFRRALRPAADLFERLADRRDGPREVVERREAEVLAARVLDKMSAVRRRTFILSEIEGYSGEEIAELDGVPVNTVYTRLHHARKDFVKYLAVLEGKEEGR